MGRQKQSLSKRPSVATKESKKEPKTKSIVEEREKVMTPEKKEYRYTCLSCHCSANNPVNFPISYSVIYAGNDHRLPYCRDCLNAMWAIVAKDYSDYQDIYRRICMYFDIYYNAEVAEIAYKESESEKRVSRYITKINRYPYSNKTYQDTIKEDMSKRHTENFDGLYEPIEKTVPHEIIDFWGAGLESASDYQELQASYEKWNSEVECSKPSQRILIKRICFNELKTHKAMIAGDDTTKLTDELNKLLDSAKLQPKQVKDVSIADENTFGTLIKKWEDEEPVPEPLPEFKDVDGIIKYISVWFYGHLAKMFGKRNKWRKLYNDEVSKYTVTPPEYNSEDDDIDFESIFGADE